MQKIEGKYVTYKLRQDQVERIERIAKRMGAKKSSVVRGIIDTGLDAHETFERVGIVKLVEVANKTRKAVEKHIQPKLL